MSTQSRFISNPRLIRCWARTQRKPMEQLEWDTIIIIIIIINIFNVA